MRTLKEVMYDNYVTSGGSDQCFANGMNGHCGLECSVFGSKQECFQDMTETEKKLWEEEQEGVEMKKNLICFKCRRDTAILTYEENRIYKVSCPCGCEYDFEHSSMKCAEEYHYKMLELYGEIDHANRLQQENEQLKELLQLAVKDINSMKLTTQCVNYLLCLSKAKSMKQAVLPCDYCSSWQWQHSDKLKGLIEI